MSEPTTCAICGQPLPPPKAKAGRPPTEPQADPAATKHFRDWLATRPGGLGIPATSFCLKDIYGPALKIHHLRKALDGSRPFYEAELDKIVAYAKDVLEYSGYTLPPAESVAKT